MISWIARYPADDIASAHWDNEILAQNMGSLGVCDQPTGPAFDEQQQRIAHLPATAHSSGERRHIPDFRDGRVLIVRRARPPAHGLYTLPGGVVELGETLQQAVIREIREETGLAIEPVVLAGYREAIVRDDAGRIERHFADLPFAARWVGGELALNEELAEARG